LFEELDVSERSAYRTGHARIFVSKLEEVSHEKTQAMLSACEKVATGAGATAEEVRKQLKVLVG
jgi:hypothetical protein